MTPPDDDTLDRLLLALPLDDVPAGLHARVMNATVAPAAAVAPLVRPWEISIVGTAIAVMVWLLGTVVMAPATGAAIADQLVTALLTVAGFVTPGALLWVAIGVSATVWISQLTLSPAPQRKQG